MIVFPHIGGGFLGIFSGSDVHDDSFSRVKAFQVQPDRGGFVQSWNLIQGGFCACDGLHSGFSFLPPRRFRGGAYLLVDVGCGIKFPHSAFWRRHTRRFQK